MVVSYLGITLKLSTFSAGEVSLECVSRALKPERQFVYKGLDPLLVIFSLIAQIGANALRRTSSTTPEPLGIGCYLRTYYSDEAETDSPVQKQSKEPETNARTYSNTVCATQ